jgi:hypothetical protein
MYRHKKQGAASLSGIRDDHLFGLTGLDHSVFVSFLKAFSIISGPLPRRANISHAVRAGDWQGPYPKPANITNPSTRFIEEKSI